jgi:iron complex outermembrane receptor protein
MTVINGETLRAANIDDFSDFQGFVPGLTAIDSGPGEKRYALRGLQSAGEPEVALYYDDISIAGLPGASLDTGDDQPDLKLWDVDRIEVLRGPQGTLYGNGAMGGAIRILSKQPDFSGFSASTQAQGAITEGGGASWGVSAMVNAPVAEDRFAVRATFYDRHNGGWIDDIEDRNIKLQQYPGDDLNWEHTWGSRLSAAFKATDRWTITGTAYYQKLQTGSSFETYPSVATADDPYVTGAFVRTPWDDQSAMAEIKSNYDLGWANFVVIGTYQNRVVDQSLDTTRFLLNQFGCTEFTWNVSCFGPPLVPAVSYAHEGVAAYSEETRLVSQGPGRFQWTAGAFLQQTSTYRHGQVAVADSSGYIDINPTTGIADNRLFARTNYDQFNQDAVYAEGTYKIASPLSLTVGLRWFHSYRSDQQIINQQFFPGQPVGLEPFQEFSQNKLVKKFQVSYSLSPTTLLYAEASQGFRAGGPNYPGGFTETAPPYGSDSLWDYEFGWKVVFDQAQVFWTGALFHIDWSNLQQLVPTELFSYIINAGSAQSDGFETELEFHPAPHVSLNFGTSYANARLVGPQPQLSDLYSGERLGGVPKWTANASVSYTVPISSQLSLVGRLDHTYKSSLASVTPTQSPAYFVIPGSNITALHVLLERAPSWTLGLHVSNLLNDFVPLSANALDSNLIHTVTAAPPRTILLDLTTRF